MGTEERYTIDDLVELTGLQRRTIRFYVEKGLLEAPAGRGRGGFYGEGQLERLREIVQAREEGRSLASIARLGEEWQGLRRSEEGGSGPVADGQTFFWELGPGLRLEVDARRLPEQAALIQAILGLLPESGQKAGPDRPRVGLPQDDQTSTNRAQGENDGRIC